MGRVGGRLGGDEEEEVVLLRDIEGIGGPMTTIEYVQS